MNFTNLLTSCEEKRQGVSNQAFNRDHQAPNEPGRSPKWSISNPSKTNEQQRCKWKPV